MMDDIVEMSVFDFHYFLFCQYFLALGDINSHPGISEHIRLLKTSQDFKVFAINCWLKQREQFICSKRETRVISPVYII